MGKRKVSKFGLGAVAVLVVLAVGGKAFAGDVEDGETVFKKNCLACHSLEKNRVGPRLGGVFGRKAGSVAGFPYSTANIESGIMWTEDKLDAYLADPQGFIPRTKMTFTGLKDAGDRKAVIAFLKTK